MNRWEMMNLWKMVLPPNRPSEANISFVNNEINKLHNEITICILGSTPEYRVVSRRKARDVFIIDSSSEFLEISTEISGTEKNENFINKDWLDALPHFKNKFDVILSHSTHGNVPFDRRRKFFSAIAESLAPNGIFIDTIFQPSSRLFDIEEIEAIFSGMPNNLRTANDFNCISIFQSIRILEDKCVDSSRIYKWLESEIKDKQVTLISKMTKNICPPGMIWHYAVDCPPETFGYSELFDVKGTVMEPEDSPFRGVMYQMISQPRGR